MNPDPTSLDRLLDIVTPPPVPLWPPAPGWYYVITFVLVLVVVILARAFLTWQRNRYRREALAELSGLENQLRAPVSRAPALAAMSALLKRAALTAFPRAQVASLTGNEWFAFLDRTGRTTAFSRGDGAKLEAASYDPHGTGDLNESTARVVAQRVRHWLRNHEVRFNQPQSSSYSSVVLGAPRSAQAQNENDGRARGTRTKDSLDRNGPVNNGR